MKVNVNTKSRLISLGHKQPAILSPHEFSDSVQTDEGISANKPAGQIRQKVEQYSIYN